MTISNHLHRSFFNMLGLFTPIFYIQLYSVNHGLDRTLAFYTVTILNGASVVCLLSHFSDFSTNSLLLLDRTYPPKSHR